jgi:hypothetical protein
VIDYEEVMRRTSACVQRLGQLESALTTSQDGFPFPADREFMPLMDTVHRAQWNFEKVLMNTDDE